MGKKIITAFATFALLGVAAAVLTSGNITSASSNCFSNQISTTTKTEVISNGMSTFFVNVSSGSAKNSATLNVGNGTWTNITSLTLNKKGPAIITHELRNSTGHLVDSKTSYTGFFCFN